MRLRPFRMGPSGKALLRVACKRPRQLRRPLRAAGSHPKRLKRLCLTRVQGLPRKTQPRACRPPTTRPSIRTCPHRSTLPTANGQTAVTGRKPSSLPAASTTLRHTNGTRLPRSSRTRTLCSATPLPPTSLCPLAKTWCTSTASPTPTCMLRNARPATWSTQTPSSAA